MSSEMSDLVFGPNRKDEPIIPGENKPTKKGEAAKNGACFRCGAHFDSKEELKTHQVFICLSLCKSLFSNLSRSSKCRNTNFNESVPL
jgi:hypothetical protein